MTDHTPTRNDLTARIAALEQEQAATAEVLRIISRSPTDLQAVLDAICERAARLCGVDDAVVHRVEGDTTRPVAHFGSLATLPMDVPQAITAGAVNGRAILERRTVHLPDFDAVPEEEYPVTTAVNGTVADVRTRSFLAVPLLREGAAIGTFFLRHREPYAYSDKQIALLQTFADQAVVAMENARLFEEVQTRTREVEERNAEMREALEQQVGVGEVLRVISSSPTNLEAVFEVLATTATRLCDANLAVVGHEVDGARLFWNTVWGHVEREAGRLTRQSFAGRAMLDRRPVHVVGPVTDWGADFPEAVRKNAGQGRESLAAYATPVLRDGAAVGYVLVVRDEPRPFTERQMALVQTFADQAMIAIENARLFDEVQSRTRELEERNTALGAALEQQTATADVLRVIASAPTDLQQVLDTILATAHRLVDVNNGGLFLYDGEVLQAAAGVDAESFAQLRAVFTQTPMRPQHGLIVEVAALERRTIHVPDASADPRFAALYSAATGRNILRTALAVPLLQTGQLRGVIFFYRTVVQPFTDEQIALVQTFADQAVIAIENARLFEELQESNASLRQALEQQTATAEVLRIINGAPSDLDAVLTTMLDHVVRLCDASRARFWRLEGEELVQMTGRGTPLAGIPLARGAAMDDARTPESETTAVLRFPMTADTIAVHALKERRTIHVENLAAEKDRYSITYRLTQEGSYPFTVMAVPLLREEQPVGALVIARQPVQPFTPGQIALVETFADQAAIAIENARLFEELQQRNREQAEALERERATSAILGVIAASTTDPQPVFDAIVESAVRLGVARTAVVYCTEGDHYRSLAAFDATGESQPSGIVQPVVPSSVVGRAILEGCTVHVFGETEDLAREFPQSGRLWQSRGRNPRAVLVVPLLREGAPIGAILVNRLHIEPFTDTQIALLETFAAQAVIAIENARLFSDLTEALEHQRATGEVLEVISRAPADAQLVLDAITEQTTRLFNADDTALFRLDADGMHRASYYPPPARTRPDVALLVDRRTVAGRAVVDRVPVHIPDLLAAGAEVPGSVWRATEYGQRTNLAVPLLREGAPLGAIVTTRLEVKPFTDREIALLETFADQAVIAIENARLFEEIQRRTRELEAANGAKSEFLSRMSHELRTPLNAIIGFAEIMEMDAATTLKQHERVGHILRGGRHLLGLINEVLDIARIEAGRLSLSLEPVALDAVLGEVLELMRPIAIDAEVDIQVADTPAMHVAVQADKGRLRQIILNLVTNGVKYNHPGGSVTLTSVTLTSGERPDGLRRLTVSDTGPGITANEIDRLFSPFERLAADQSGVEGTGLGLAIAKRLAEAMGGDIGVESVVGQGSVFWLDLPTAALPLDLLPAPEDETQLTAANGAARSATVLYIEDNLPNVELVQHILGFRPGVTLLTAPRAEVGLRLAGRYLPDLILLDLNLPDLQGDEALARLRADPRTAAIPVVMISADATEAQIQRLLAAGARDYLTKPLDVKRFLALIDEQLDKVPATPRRSPTPSPEVRDESP